MTTDDLDRMRRQALLTRYATLNGLGLPQFCQWGTRWKVIFPDRNAAEAYRDKVEQEWPRPAAPAGIPVPQRTTPLPSHPRQERRAESVMTCQARRHGNNICAYKKGCRCPGARAAKAAEHRRNPRPPHNPSPDHAAVMRACLGDRSIRLTPTERRTAIQILSDRGRSQQWIAEQLGVSRRTVVRHRQASQQAA